MYKLVGKQLDAQNNEIYAIFDDKDGKIDIVTAVQVKNFLSFGFSIEGIEARGTDFVAVAPEIQEDDEEEEFEDYEEFEGEDDFEDEDENEEDGFGGEEEYEGEDDFEDEEDEEDPDLFDDEDYEEEYYEEEDDEDEYVDAPANILYQHLDAKQKDILQRYYLWQSREVFNAGKVDIDFGLKDKKYAADKQKVFDRIKAGGTCWNYGGFIDLGSEIGECVIGDKMGHSHIVRYIHLVWDAAQSDMDLVVWNTDYTVEIDKLIQSQKVLVFGIKCLCDFFGVGKEGQAELMRAQRQALNEMGELSEIYSDSTKLEDARKSFEIFDKVMDMYVPGIIKQYFLTQGKETMHGLAGYALFYKEFKEAGMLYPRSLVLSLRDSLFGWTSHDTKVYSFLSAATIKDAYERAGFLRQSAPVCLSNLFKALEASNKMRLGNEAYGDAIIYRYLEWYLRNRICGIYEYNPNSDKPIDRKEGLTNKTSKETFKLRNQVLRRLFPGKGWGTDEESEIGLDYLKELDDFAKFKLDCEESHLALLENLVTYNKLNERIETIPESAKYHKDHATGIYGGFDYGIARTLLGRLLSDVLAATDEHSEAYSSLVLFREANTKRREGYSRSPKFEDNDKSRGSLPEISFGFYGNRLSFREIVAKAHEDNDFFLDKTYIANVNKAFGEYALEQSKKVSVPELKKAMEEDIEAVVTESEEAKRASRRVQVQELLDRIASKDVLELGKDISVNELSMFLTYAFNDSDYEDKVASADSFCKNVSKTVARRGTISGNQFRFVALFFNSLTGKVLTSDSVNANTSTSVSRDALFGHTMEELVFYSKEAKTNPVAKGYKSVKFVSDVLNTVTDNGYMSHKQQYYIEKFIEWCNERNIKYSAV